MAKENKAKLQEEKKRLQGAIKKVDLKLKKIGGMGGIQEGVCFVCEASCVRCQSTTI